MFDLCLHTDFSRQSPEGTFYHSGAFCGVFISNDTSKPFMGLGFKVRFVALIILLKLLTLAAGIQQSQGLQYRP